MLWFVIPLLVAVALIWLFVRVYRSQKAMLGQALPNEWRLLREPKARWTRYLLSVGLVSLAITIVTMIGANMSTYGSSTQDDIGTFFIFVAIPTWSVGLAFWVRIPYAKSQRADWRRILLFTLGLWIIYLVIGSVPWPNGLGTKLSLPVTVCLLPSMLWFPIWTFVAYLRGRKKAHPAQAEVSD